MDVAELPKNLANAYLDYAEKVFPDEEADRSPLENATAALLQACE